MQDKVNLYYEGQQGRLALRCCMRLVWGDVNFVISAQRYSDSPQEAQVALLETLGQRYINLSKEAERHQKRSLELEAQLGDALRSAEVAREGCEESDEELADKVKVIRDYRDRLRELEEQLGEAVRRVEIFRDENQEFKDVLLEKDERILDLEREVLNLRQHHDQLMASSTRQWELRGEAGVQTLNAEDRVKEVERHLASAIAAGQIERETGDEARRGLVEQIETTRLLQVELAALRARNAELELLPARLTELEEEARLARMDQDVMVRQLKKVIVLAKVVIDSSKKEE